MTLPQELKQTVLLKRSHTAFGNMRESFALNPKASWSKEHSRIFDGTGSNSKSQSSISNSASGKRRQKGPYQNHSSMFPVMSSKGQQTTGVVGYQSKLFKRNEGNRNAYQSHLVIDPASR